MDTKKILIDIDLATEARLQALAARHNQKLKPFIEYLLQLQAGTQELPVAKPIAFDEDATEAHTSITEKPDAKKQPKEVKLEAARKAMETVEKRPRNEADFKKRVEECIYTDGIAFRVNKFGAKSYHDTLEAARTARDSR